MAEILSIQHERVDDVPVIIGVANKIGLAGILNATLGTHSFQQGLTNEHLAVGWLGYILSQADHRKSAVREWANGLPHTLTRLLGHPIRDVDFGLSPLFVWKDDQIKGLTRLLTLALRLLILIETQVPQGLQQAGQRLSGLYPGQANRQTEQPAGQRILQAFSRAQLTLTRLGIDVQVQWHITELSELHKQLLRYLHLSWTLHSALLNNSS